MKKIILFIPVLISLYTGNIQSQEAFKLSLKQPPLLTIAISENVYATSGEIINLDTLFHITGASSFTREWKFRDGSIHKTIDNPLFTVTGDGVFLLTVINENGCTAIDSIILTIATATEDVYKKDNLPQSIYVYPNPNTGTLNILINDCLPGFFVELVNSAGIPLLIKSLDCDNNTYSGTITIPDIKSGTIFLFIKNGNKIIFRQKVIIIN